MSTTVRNDLRDPSPLQEQPVSRLPTSQSSDKGQKRFYVGKNIIEGTLETLKPRLDGISGALDKFRETLSSFDTNIAIPFNRLVTIASDCSDNIKALKEKVQITGSSAMVLFVSGACAALVVSNTSGLSDSLCIWQNQNDQYQNNLYHTPDQNNFYKTGCQIVLIAAASFSLYSIYNRTLEVDKLKMENFKLKTEKVKLEEERDKLKNERNDFQSRYNALVEKQREELEEKEKKSNQQGKK